MKKWYQSKTLWVNLISLFALGTHYLLGIELLSPESQAIILSFINIILRVVTKSEIVWGEE